MTKLYICALLIGFLAATVHATVDDSEARGTALEDANTAKEAFDFMVSKNGKIKLETTVAGDSTLTGFKIQSVKGSFEGRNMKCSRNLLNSGRSENYKCEINEKKLSEKLQNLGMIKGQVDAEIAAGGKCEAKLTEALHAGSNSQVSFEYEVICNFNQGEDGEGQDLIRVKGVSFDNEISHLELTYDTAG